MTIGVRSSRSWPIGIALSLLSVIGVNVFMAVMAFRSSAGEYERSPYEKGLAYQKIIDAKHAFAQRGWTSHLATARDDARAKVIVTVSVVDAAGAPVSGLKGLLKAMRPSNAKADQEHSVVESAPGEYAAELDSPVSGLWLLHVSLIAGEQEFLIEEQQML